MIAGRVKTRTAVACGRGRADGRITRDESSSARGAASGVAHVLDQICPGRGETAGAIGSRRYARPGKLVAAEADDEADTGGIEACVLAGPHPDAAW